MITNFILCRATVEFVVHSTLDFEFRIVFGEYALVGQSPCVDCSETNVAGSFGKGGLKVPIVIVHYTV